VSASPSAALPSAPSPSALSGSGREPTTACPGCGAVLVPVPDVDQPHPGASPSCTRLFEVTTRGIRDDAATEPETAALARLADATYDAQHPFGDDPARLTAAVTELAERLGGPPPAASPMNRPVAWQMTIADVAADLDVVDLPSLIDAWARAVFADWR
jgi:Family of unknown function (DUF5946)